MDAIDPAQAGAEADEVEEAAMETKVETEGAT
jgi:hypothetical protein